MAEVLPGIHIVEGTPEPNPGTHPYLVKDQGGTWTMIDTGMPGADVGLAAYLKKIKVEPTSIKKIVLTHTHRDHVGGLAKTIALTKARTFSHWLEAAFIAKRPEYDGPGMHPLDAVTIDETLKDGDALDAAGGLTFHHTPGHTPGHSVLYHADRKLLFSGDLFFGTPEGGLMLTTPEYTHHLLSAQVSARRVSQLAVESVLTYHGGPILKGGGAAIRAVTSKF